jgi:hypothetical protein
MWQSLTDLPTMLLQVAPSAEGARNYSQCDSMLIGDGAAANTYPYIQVRIMRPPRFCQLHGIGYTKSTAKAHAVILSAGR